MNPNELLKKFPNMSPETLRLNTENPSPNVTGMATDGIMACGGTSERVRNKKSVVAANKRIATIKMLYIGNVLSVNHYKHQGKYTKLEAKEWSNDLVHEIKSCKIDDWHQPLMVKIAGFYKNARETPDTHNLIKIICDAIQEATGLNDKYYKTETEAPKISKEPHILVTISEV